MAAVKMHSIHFGESRTDEHDPEGNAPEQMPKRHACFRVIFVCPTFLGIPLRSHRIRILLAGYQGPIVPSSQQVEIRL
jgi:hypothetical protein